MHMKDHIVLFDNTCPICRRAVARAIELDRKKVFLFSPLDGKTAKQALKGKMAYLRKKRSLIIIENAHRPPSLVWMHGRAAMRLFWILGGVYKCVGFLCYIPLLTDAIYKGISNLRHRIEVKDVPERFFRAHQERFLP